MLGCCAEGYDVDSADFVIIAGRDSKSAGGHVNDLKCRFCEEAEVYGKLQDLHKSSVSDSAVLLQFHS